MKAKSQKTRTWTYGRAFLLTLGIVLVALVFVVWIAQGNRSGEWPLVAWCLIGSMVCGGISLCSYALRGLDSSISSTIDYTGKHEAEVFIVLLAGPVYWIGKIFIKHNK